LAVINFRHSLIVSRKGKANPSGALFEHMAYPGEAPLKDSSLG